MPISELLLEITALLGERTYCRMIRSQYFWDRLDLMEESAFVLVLTQLGILKTDLWLKEEICITRLSIVSNGLVEYTARFS